MSQSRKLHSRKGSVLLVVVFLAVAMSVIVGGYLSMTLREMRFSDETLMRNALLNLCEAGAEEAMWAINRNDWTGWSTLSGGTLSRTMRGIDIGGGRTGEVTVAVLNRGSNSPVITAEGRIPHPLREHIMNKQVEIGLTRRGLWNYAMAAKKSITLNGNNFTVDSFSSSHTMSMNGDPAYDWAYRRDNGSVGCLAVTMGSIDIGNANIFGYVATGGGAPDVGPNGEIRGFDTPGTVKVDTDRIAFDFWAEFKLIEAPPTTPSTLTSLPPPSSQVVEIGDPTGNTVQTYRISNLRLQNNPYHTLRIVGPVVLIVDGDVSMSGNNATIDVSHTGNLEMYVNGDFSCGGNGVVNRSNVAANCLIFGTNPTPNGQTFTLHGNGGLTGAVYAPNARATLNGGGNRGQMTGSLVANEITINGGGSTYGFHYDEDLAELRADGSFRMDFWRELHLSGERRDFSHLRQR